MHSTFASDVTLAETALSVTGGGEVVTVVPEPDADGRRLVVVNHDDRMLHVLLDPRLGVAEVWLAERFAVAA